MESQPFLFPISASSLATRSSIMAVMTHKVPCILSQLIAEEVHHVILHVFSSLATQDIHRDFFSYDDYRETRPFSFSRQRGTVVASLMLGLQQ
ncbi:hypothetical protein TIFTF001_041822 [Ficus carica]|uniref:Uncharacterized protein n=1 Tax=Ficus carica TaxID=3494 RepID=A0AA88CV46_FICCA|nr:hypothetical protein TIFTF001_041820 [Ficus carica]GMN33010.1 hypothetical protein TIFTF001_041822 [Ficus carica]